MHPITHGPTVAEIAGATPPWERHYTVGELALLWGFGRTTVRNWFQSEPGVLRNGEARLRRGRKNPYTSLRIPESVAQRVYKRHMKAV
jgi:hypothetical protein